MSTKGTQLTTTTKNRISLAKTQYTTSALVQAGNKYIDKLITDPKRLPTVSGYCLEAGISESRLREVSQTKPEVQAILEYIELAQQEYALTNGITNKANPIFSIFLLKTKHGYQDQPNNLSQTNNFNISPEVLGEALKLMSKDKS